MTYIAIAYRWGWSNNSWYIVYEGDDEERVCLEAERECRERGGKYGVEVLRLDGEDQTRVAFYPSTYGEKFPEYNHRIEAAKSIGLSVMGASNHGNFYVSDPDRDGFMKSIDVELPWWLQECTDRSIRMAKVVEESINSNRAKQ